MVQDDIAYPELPPQSLMSGSEPIRGGGLSREGTMLGYWRWAHSDLTANADRGGGLSREGTMLGYWRWAHSDLTANADRGVFAEYLVRLALGLNGVPSEAWAA